MITEIAQLHVITGQSQNFENSFSIAEKIIVQSSGYIHHQLLKCIEKENQYLLIVNWNTLEDHTIGFRQSESYRQWKALLHHFYEPFPVVEHYKTILENKTNL